MPKLLKFNGSDEPDAANAALRKQAREGAGDAMAGLLELAQKAQSESVKLAAIKEVFDRAFGRAGQGGPAGAIIAHVLIDDGYGN